VFDGIADMMAFGVGPAVYYAHQVLRQQPAGSQLAPLHVAAVTAYVVAAVYRISRFLVLTFNSRVVNFRGMPTNVAGCCLHTLLWLFGISHWTQVWAMFFLSYMMVSEFEFSKPAFLL
jgi:phosphatidylserine synthase